MCPSTLSCRELVVPGNIIVRQRGTKYHPVWEAGTVGMGRDHTIFAKTAGKVQFVWNEKRRRQFIAVIPADADASWLDQHIVEGKRSPSWATY